MTDTTATNGSDFNDILSAGLSAACGTTILTYDEYQKTRKEKKVAESWSSSPDWEEVDVDRIFKMSHIFGPVGNAPTPESLVQSIIHIFVMSLTGEILSIDVQSNSMIEKIKHEIQDKKGIPPDMQRLVFGGKTLDDDCRLEYYSIQNDSVIHLFMMVRGGETAQLVLSPDTLDPAYDYDYTYEDDDGTKFSRGGYPYYRPYGWYRYGLKVKGKYEDDEWLGYEGYRTGSSEGEWPVSYHGTAKDNANSIANNGYLLSKCRRDIFATKGIYQAPRIETAEYFATDFTFKGKQHKLVFQNRVSSEGLIIIDGSETGQGDYWAQRNPDFMRPYGICIKEIREESTCAIL